MSPECAREPVPKNWSEPAGPTDRSLPLATLPGILKALTGPLDILTQSGHGVARIEGQGSQASKQKENRRPKLHAAIATDRRRNCKSLMFLNQHFSC